MFSRCRLSICHCVVLRIWICRAFAKVMSNMPESNMPHSNMPHSNMPHSNMPHGNMPHGNMPHGNLPQSNMPESNMPSSSTMDSNRPTTSPSGASTSSPVGSQARVEGADQLDEQSRTGPEPHRARIWVAVQELKLSYYIGETLVFTIYTHYDNLD